MRLILTLLTIFFVGVSLGAQSTSILVLQPESGSTDLASSLPVQSSLQDALDTALGVDTYGSLGCRLSIRSISSQRISGMAKRTITRYDYELSFLDYVLAIPVGEAIRGKVNGTGGDDNSALMDALNNIRKTQLSKEQLMMVIEQHQSLLPDCAILLERLSALSDEGKATEVFAVYAQLLSTHACYASIETLVDTLYQKQQAADCQALLIKAKSMVVSGQITRAARLLSSVDPTLACAEKVDALLDELMKKDTARVDLDWYHRAYLNRSVSPYVRRRIISNLVYAYVRANY